MNRELVRETQKEIEREIKIIRETLHDLQPDAAFVLWFIREHILEPSMRDISHMYLTGVSGDKGIDALYIDDKYKNVHIVQGKFNRPIARGNEPRTNVLNLADLADIHKRSPESLNSYFNDIDGSLAEKLKEAIKKLNGSEYKLKLYYLTTKNVSKTILRDARSRVLEISEDSAELHVYDGRWVVIKFQDYLVGAAPAVPRLKLRITTAEGATTEGKIYRYDARTKIETYIFPMTTNDVGQLYKDQGPRLFSRNIRGDLGPGNAKSINNAIRDSVKKEPENFWYYNNGITMICTSAKQEKEKGTDYLYIHEPSIINGQQTTIALADAGTARANVLVRVIVVPAAPDNMERYNEFVNSIVSATNRQNAIKLSDLVANDPKQVLIERILRDRKYLYQRKRRSRAEEKTIFGNGLTKISKETLAQVQAAIIFDPSVVKKTDSLFESDIYRHIFKEEKADYYLLRYWLMDKVKKNATKTEMTRANYLILKFIWDNWGRDLEDKEKSAKFIKMCENKKNIPSLGIAISNIFKSAERFYKLTNAKEERDIRSFFTDKKTLGLFKKFWNSNKNKYRRSTHKKFEHFLAHLVS